MRRTAVRAAALLALAPLLVIGPVLAQEVSVPTPVPEQTAEPEPAPTSEPSASSTPPLVPPAEDLGGETGDPGVGSVPLPVGPLPGTPIGPAPTDGAGTEPVAESEPLDPLNRLVQLAVAAAVLLGVGGGAGLYLTRKGR